MLSFPIIDPVAIEIGPIAIRWYALAYIAGLVLGWRYALVLARTAPTAIAGKLIDDYLTWAVLAIILGGRLGYALFYQPGVYLEDPVRFLKIWEGGMAFHGGFLGIVVLTLVFCRQHKINLLAFGDIIAMVAPIGLCLGRIANFINGELWGRVTDVSWGMVFPTGGPLPRHPSQLYQAALEGVALFAVLWALNRAGVRRSAPGAMIGAFLIGYGIARLVGEVFRQPDPQLGFLLFGATMGQLLSLPMVLAGVGFVWFARRRP
jgi:phosphatidylglycerol:prolipoprotein diacylglycerol transferase